MVGNTVARVGDINWNTVNEFAKVRMNYIIKRSFIEYNSIAPSGQGPVFLGYRFYDRRFFESDLERI